MPEPERFPGRQRHGGAPRGPFRFAPDGCVSQTWCRALRARQVKGSASRRSAHPSLARGGLAAARATADIPAGASAKAGAKEERDTRTQQGAAGAKKTALFEMVKMEDASGASLNVACEADRVGGNAPGSRPRARLRASAPARTRPRIGRASGAPMRGRHGRKAPAGCFPPPWLGLALPLWNNSQVKRGSRGRGARARRPQLTTSQGDMPPWRE